ncbi:hypothetical protein [Actinomyces sp. MRS3W]|uniref:hypothetical protein n=1 Tax=Actinomyces sp. MRS3W TaxID=2800796 RepID=UPI002905AD68|nr:hypothetical protein [Actinomyces sp. MRS3W]
MLSHEREVFIPAQNQACGQDALVLFLGGQPGVDVINPRLTVAEADRDSSVCTVTDTDDEQLEGTLAGIWATDSDGDGYLDGGQYRLCLNGQGLELGCAEPHQTEIFYVGTQSVDCRAQYETFTGRGFAADSGSLKVVSGTRGDSPACWLEVLADNDQLTASARSLGDTALPITH